MPNFPYSTGIPASTHNPSVDQPDMQTNTNSIDSIIGIDHFGFNSSSNNSGWHKQSTYVNETTPTTTLGQLALYSKGAAGGPSQLFLVRDNNAGTEVAMTPNPLVVGAPLRAQNGVSWLPGNLLIQWGVGTAATGTPGAPVQTVIPYSQNFSADFDPVVTISQQVTGQNPELVISVFVLGNSNFIVFNKGAARFIYWMAIGPI